MVECNHITLFCYCLLHDGQQSGSFSCTRRLCNALRFFVVQPYVFFVQLHTSVEPLVSRVLIALRLTVRLKAFWEMLLRRVTRMLNRTRVLVQNCGDVILVYLYDTACVWLVVGQCIPLRDWTHRWVMSGSPVDWSEWRFNWVWLPLTISGKWVVEVKMWECVGMQ